MPSTSDHSLSKGKTVETDLDGLIGREFSSGKRHDLHLRKESWVPWLTFTNLWNSANAYNLALFSELSYQDFDKIRDFFSDVLRNKKASKDKITLEGNSLVSGGSRRLLTRSVLEEHRFQNPQFWDIDGMQAFAVNSADQVLISIRGTDEPADWSQNLQAPSVPFKEGPGAYWTESGEELQVHEGFYKGFLSLKDGLDDYLNDHLEGEDGHKDVFVCGHSLGGALGLLTAAYLTSSWGVPPVLYTYGMPRVGERAFAEHYAADGKEPLIHHRHVHHRDLVPKAPPPKHEGDVRRLPIQLISPTGITRAGVSQYNWDSAYTHHGLLTYLPPVDDAASRPILEPKRTDVAGLVASLTDALGKTVLDYAEEGSVLGLFHETPDADTLPHKKADHSPVAYATVIRRRLDLEVDTFLENACGDGAKAKGSRIGVRDASGGFQPQTERVNELREELTALWEQEASLIAEEREASKAEKRPAYLADDEALKTLHQKQKQKEEALSKALKQRASTFKDERSFLLQTPEPDWPEQPCRTLNRFQGSQ